MAWWAKSRSTDSPLDDGQSRQRTNSIMLILTVAGSAWFLLAFFLYWLRFHTAAISDEGKDWGDFGVFIGGLAGTGIAAVTLYAVAYGIRVQAEDLAKSRAFMAKQSGTMAQQAFDSVFFGLLERFSQVRDGMTYTYTKTVSLPELSMSASIETGKDARRAFHSALEPMKKAYVARADGEARGVAVNPANYKDFVVLVFDKVYEAKEPEFGPYFRTLYHIFKFIERGYLSDEQKKVYASMARAQLSDPELCIIFYDGVTARAEKFKPLIEKYGILKHVNASNLLQEDDKRNPMFYDTKAFE
jgi:Putative phage abortive infection protein